MANVSEYSNLQNLRLAVRDSGQDLAVLRMRRKCTYFLTY